MIYRGFRSEFFILIILCYPLNSCYVTSHIISFYFSNDFNHDLYDVHDVRN